MEDGDTEKYHPSRVIQDFVFLSRKRGCIRCISLQVYNKVKYHTCPRIPNGKVTNPINITNKSQEVSPFPSTQLSVKF